MLNADSPLQDTPPPDPQPGPGLRRRQIVAAAAALFAERGYHGTTMQDIGARVGMLKGSLYAHVTNKEELLLEILSSAARAFATAFAQAEQDARAPEEQLRLAIQGHLGVLAQHTDLAAVYGREWRHLTGQPATWMRETRERYLAGWRALFQHGVEQGAFRADLDYEAAAMLVLSAADGALAWWVTGDRGSMERLATAYTDLVLAACRRRDQSPAPSLDCPAARASMARSAGSSGEASAARKSASG